MTRLGAVFWLVLVLAAGFTTFKVKYAIQDTEDQLNRVRRQTIAEQQEIRVLTAEWTYLNQPERLSELNRRFLGLASITTKQLQRTVDEIPMRAPTAPPDALAEASPDPAEPQAATPPAVTSASLSPTPAVSGPLPVASRAIVRDDAPEADRPHPPTDAAPARPARAGLVQLAKAGPVQLAKVGPAETANSLDALIAQIVETR